MDGSGVVPLLLIVGLLVLPPLVLWKCKGFCEKHPSTVPFRTVPLGCLATLGLEALFSSAVYWLFHKVLGRNPPNWMELPMVLLAIFLGIWVIVRLSELLTKGRKSPPGCLYPLVLVGTVTVVLVISFFCTTSEPYYVIHMPAVQNCEIAFEQRPSHPFLAEYDYRIRLGKGNDKAYFQLWPNTGGRTFVNVYRVADDKLMLKDKDAAYLVDIAQRRVYMVDTERGSDQSWKDIHSAIPLCEKVFHLRSSDTVVFTDETKSQAVPYDVDLSSCEYIGCIMDYSFYTPDQQPEGEGHPRYRD